MCEKLDIGCGNKKLEGYVGIDNRNYVGVDIVHDIEVFPWPFESEHFLAINASHVLEHIKPWKLFDLMDEAWRVLKPDGEIKIRVPFGLSYKVDPSHIIEFCIPSFWYFDINQDFYQTYKPKPWTTIKAHAENATQEITVILRKHREPKDSLEVLTEMGNN